MEMFLKSELFFFCSVIEITRMIYFEIRPKKITIVIRPNDFYLFGLKFICKRKLPLYRHNSVMALFSAFHSHASNTFQCSGNHTTESKLSPQSNRRRRFRVSDSDIELLRDVTPTIFYDTFYDTVDSWFTDEEWASSFLKQKCWLIRRDFLDGGTEWMLKAFSDHDRENNNQTWLQVFGEKPILDSLNLILKLGAKSLPPSPYQMVLMRFRTSRYTVAPNKWIDICGWEEEPLGAYAVLSCNDPSSFPTHSTDIIPSKTKVMLYFLHNAAFKLAFGEDDEMLDFILSVDDAQFKTYDDFLKLSESAAKYLAALPRAEDD